MKVLIAVLLSCLPAFAADITALSMSHTDVTNAVSTAVSGDRVLLPAGVAHWTNGISINLPISIIGQGGSNSVIIDDLPGNTSQNEAVFFINSGGATGTNLFRMSGIFITHGTETAPNGYHGAIQLYGNGTNIRFDHMGSWKINNYFMKLNNGSYGVVDHCTFYTPFNHAIVLWMDTWGGGDCCGDGSWATADTLGQSNKWYIEANYFRCVNGSSFPGGAVDAFSGARYVFRYNTVIDDNISVHGTESSQNYRGGMEFEAYGNMMTNTISTIDAFDIRSGYGVICSNICWGYPYMCILLNDRSHDPFTPWAGANGYSGFDKATTNAGAPQIFYTGTHTGPNNIKSYNDGTAAWTPHQWAPTNGGAYCIINTNNNRFSCIIDNTTTNITYSGEKDSGNALWWTNGNGSKITFVAQVLDGIGVGQGSVITQPGGVPTPKAWPNQVINPWYEWQNTNITGMNGFNPHDSSIVFGVHYNNNTNRPGYVPFIYPHPLVVTPSAPTFTVQPFGGFAGVGAGFTFISLATGNPVITYQWRKGGVNLAGKTDSNLVLSNVQLSDSGVYDVAATNGFGFAISSPATLTVTPLPPPSPPTVFRIISVSGKVITNIFSQ